MDKLLENPWFLRLTALFLAILLFFTVQEERKSKTNVSGESSDVLRDIPVEVFYDNENLIVTGVPETVDVRIEGPMNIVKTTTLIKDFSLAVDLTTLPMGEHRVKIQHENLSDKLDVKITPAEIDVVIEEKITKTFKVEPEFNRQLLAEDFHIVNMEVEPSTIEVTGAKSVVESISFVKATVSSEQGVNQSFEQEANVRVLDRDLNKLDLLIAPEKVKVKVNVQENYKEVPLVIHATGTPPEGVMIQKLTTEEKTVTLFGPSRVLDEIGSLRVEVDVSKITKSGIIDIELKKPKDVSKLSMSQVKVIVDAQVEKLPTKDEKKEKDEKKSEESTEREEQEQEQDVVVKDEPVEEPEVEDKPIEEPVVIETVKFEGLKVAVLGLDARFKGTILNPAERLVTLTVTAEADVIGRLKKSDFNVSVDASSVSTEGEQRFPITVNGPTDVDWVLSEKEITLKIELV